MRKPTVLLVDYDPASIDSARGPLSDAGYEVEVAKNGLAGLEAFRHVDPDLVLTQMMLPRLAGLDLCREIRKTRPAGRPPIIVYGTTNAERGRSQAIAAGADGYLVAPMNPETLLETCNEYLTGSVAKTLDETGGPPEPGGAPGDGPLAEESEQAAAAAAILDRLDAFLPSRQVGLPATPVVERAAAAPAAVVRHETPAPSTVPALPQLAVAACPPVSAVATVKRPLPPAPGKGSGREGVRWARVLPALALGSGLLVAILALRGRVLPNREEGDPVSSGADRSTSSEAAAQVAETPTESRSAAATVTVPANLAPAVGSPERRAAAARSVPPSAATKPATEPRPESAADAVRTSLPPTATSESPEANARSVGAEPVPEPVVVPETRPAPVAAVPEAPPEPDDASDGPLKSLSPDPPGPAVPETRATTASPPPPAVSTGDLVELGSADTPPVVKTRSQPAYPEFARRMRYSGTVVLRVLVDEAGRVTEAAAEGDSARPEFIAAAIRAVRTWTYFPARKNGVPVKTRLTVQVLFQP